MRTADAPLAPEALRSSARQPAPAAGRTLTRHEMLRFLGFIEEMQSEGAHVLPLSTPDSYLHITIHLMRNHIEGKLTTISTLAMAARVPYATAVRRIREMQDEGLIHQRPRTKSGKSFSLHPSPGLIDAWHSYAHRIKLVVGRTIGLSEQGEGADYYFGGSYLKARIIPLPAVHTERLKLVGPLRLLVHADPTFMAMDTLKRQLENVLGASVRARALSIDRLRLEMLENAAAPVSAYDIMAVDLPWVGEFAEQGVLGPLDEVVASEGINRSDFHPAGWNGAVYKGQLYGVPIQTTPELLAYRTDLFEAEGIDPPTTTDALLAAARTLHRPDRGVRGIAWNAARGTPLGHTVLMLMGAFGRPALNLPRLEDGFDATDLTGERLRPMFDTPEAAEMADFLMRLMEVSPRNILSMSWYERVVAYGDGDVAMAYTYTLLAPYFENDPSRPAHARTGFVPHPAGPHGHPIAPVGGYVLSMAANLAPERRDAVGKALALLTSAEVSKLYITSGSRACPRFSVTADPEVRALSPALASMDTMARQGLLQYWPRPPAPQLAGVIEICGHLFHDMLRGLVSPRDALAAVQSRTEALMLSRTD
ncbi:extracellular solute-binding protein [Acuticoccus sp. M5D2P5]|uniref:ABC transporter substrate-binding protein n=1 Tax=Acuticoccus kalidii TaxID=2910977 RepID=UPI001F27091F|nr:extracellular solute-binding protein [Acuticoccus kalidii]MCF3933900.1 extracellular solute-binding protein [Acuticoccus kalidii]